MDELLSKLQGILSTPEGQQQLHAIQSMLGGDTAQPSGPEAASQPAAAPQPPPPAPLQAQAGGGNALSGLMELLGGGTAPSPAPQAGSGGPDLSSLFSMLKGETAAPPQSPGMPNIDVNLLMKLQQIFTRMNQADDKDTRLLLALKPHFSERRQARLDQAMSLMRLMTVMPMLREVFPI